MRYLVSIVFLLLLNLNGCTNHSVLGSNESAPTNNTILSDKCEANIETLYNALADNRNALQEEANVCSPTTSFRIVNNRNRIVHHNVTMRQTLLSTHRPVVAKLIHHSITQLVAFPKEYHIFRLRRILI